jgi:hypothetical protein
MHQRRRIAGLLVTLPLVLSAGCTAGADEEPSATSTASSSSAAPTTTGSRGTSAGASPTDEQLPEDAAFAADTSDDGGAAQTGSRPDPPGQMRVAGLRLATHEGYDRLVIDLNTDGVPVWTAGYTEASGPGGGPVQIDGDVFLRVRLKTDAQPGGQGQSQVTASPGPIAAVKTTGFFEGYEEVLIGIRGNEAPFRAFALTDPGRIVIDVRPAG